MLNGEAAKTNFIVFCMIQQGLECTILNIRGNNNTTDGVNTGTGCIGTYKTNYQSTWCTEVPDLLEVHK
jgi:hypothetical protein